MKYQKSLLYLLLASVLILSGCASKRYAKRGAKYEASGMYEMAVKSYIISLNKNHKNATSRIGLMRSSTIFLEELQDNMESAYNAFNDEQVVNVYTQMTELKKSCDRLQVPLEINQRYTTQFNEIKTRYAEDCYQKALKAKSEKRYTDALTYLHKIEKVNSNYKDSQALILFCKCQPLYDMGEKEMANKYYRLAYNHFNQVIKLDAKFKDAETLKQNCLYEGKQQMTFNKIKYKQYAYSDFANTLASKISNKINSRRDPFLEIVNSKTIQQLQAQQKERMRMDVNYVPTDIIPIRTNLSLNVNRIYSRRSRLSENKRRGYIRSVVKDSAIYTKIYYYEYTQSLTVYTDLDISATDVRNGSVLIASSISPSQKDAIHYIYYNGDTKLQLVPGSWGKKSTKFNPKEDTVDDGHSSRRKMRDLIKGRTRLKDESKLINKILDAASSSMANTLKKLSPQK